MMKNPDVCRQRGCFLRREEDGRVTVVDYPTWTKAAYGQFATFQNAPLEGEAEATFASESEAMKFCAEENYLVCRAPRPKTEDDSRQEKKGAWL